MKSDTSNALQHQDEQPQIEKGRPVNKDRLAVLFFLLAVIIIAAFSGYRLQIGPNNLIFERANGSTATLH